MKILFYWLMDKLFPAKCILCKKILDQDETDLCRRCRVEAPEHSQKNLKLQFLDSWAAVWYYEDNVRQSLLRYKFHNARSYAPAYGRLLAMRLRREYPQGFDILTWVPVSSLRKLRRGYDQVELLAKYVARELDMVPTATLVKRRHNRKQSGIVGYAQRKANVLGAYRCVHPEVFQGKCVMLLDDILTTGATAGECARILLTAGASEVHCGVVAASRKNKKPK